MPLARRILLICAAALVGCQNPIAPAPLDRLSPVGLTDGVDATVVWRDLEGGFWALETTDGRILDPHESLPTSFRTAGRRVHVASRPLANVACFHMHGIIVEITAIRAR